MDRKTMNAAHVVEHGEGSSPRGTRMRVVRPVVDDAAALFGHMCSCGHPEADHVLDGSTDSPLCTAEVEDGTGAWGGRVCSCMEFEHAYCVYGSGCSPEQRCGADEHYDGAVAGEVPS